MYRCPACGHGQRAPMAICPACGKLLTAPATSSGARSPGVLPSNVGTFQVERSQSHSPMKLIVALVIVGALVLAALNLAPIGEAIGPSCSLGVTRTAATITIRGWLAPTACKQALSSTTANIAGLGSFSLLQARPTAATGQVVCEQTAAGLRVTVRDAAGSRLLTRTLCDQLPRLAERANVVNVSGPLLGIAEFVHWLKAPNG